MRAPGVGSSSTATIILQTERAEGGRGNVGTRSEERQRIKVSRRIGRENSKAKRGKREVECENGETKKQRQERLSLRLM